MRNIFFHSYTNTVVYKILYLLYAKMMRNIFFHFYKNTVEHKCIYKNYIMLYFKNKA